MINIRISGAIISLVIPVSTQVGPRGVLKWGGLSPRKTTIFKGNTLKLYLHVYHVKCEDISKLEFKQMQSNQKALD